MKKTNKLLALLSASSLLGLTFTNTVNADEKSTSSVSFEAGTGKNEVVNPLDPSKPIDPNLPANPDDPGNKGTGAEGPLTIDYVSNFDFGVRAISSKDENYTLSSKDGKNNQQTPFIQVTDSRGTLSGWSLTAKISDFKAKNNDGSIISGASLTIHPTNDTATGAYNNKTTPPSTQTVEFKATNTTENVMDATSGQGGGTWLNLINPDKTSLFIPGGSARSGSYEATITWSLASGPQNASATQTNTDTASSENA